MYIDVSFDYIKFSHDSIFYSGKRYSPKSYLISIGAGLSQEFVLNRFTINPLLGGYFYYVHVTDYSLVDEMNKKGGMQRQVYGGLGVTKNVGPVLRTPEGYTFGLEIGSRFGFKISESVEINGTISYNPHLPFSTENSLYGEYWGEYPYSNPYKIKLNPLKVEGSLKFCFD